MLFLNDSLVILTLILMRLKLNRGNTHLLLYRAIADNPHFLFFSQGVGTVLNDDILAPGLLQACSRSYFVTPSDSENLRAFETFIKLSVEKQVIHVSISINPSNP